MFGPNKSVLGGTSNKSALGNSGLNQYQSSYPTSVDINYPTKSVECAVPQEYGVSSATAELMEEVRSASSLNDQLKDTLGISEPETAKGVDQSATLVGTLRAAVGILRHANAGVADSIRHLRS